MKELGILIVDDEPPARARLRSLLADLGEFRFVDEAADGPGALERCRQQPPDVVLLDIRMPGMSGLEVAHHLRALEPSPAVVFTTAYDEHALEAFEAQAVGYLLKPVRAQRLERALQQAARLAPAQLAGLARRRPEAERRRHVASRHRDELRLIPVSEILYFRADQKYVTVRHLDGEALIEESLKQLEDEFADAFVRVHRNALAALDHADALEKQADGHYALRLRHCPEALPVSRRQLPELRRRLKGS